MKVNELLEQLSYKSKIDFQHYLFESASKLGMAHIKEELKDEKLLDKSYAYNITLEDIGLYILEKDKDNYVASNTYAVLGIQGNKIYVLNVNYVAEYNSVQSVNLDSLPMDKIIGLALSFNNLVLEDKKYYYLVNYEVISEDDKILTRESTRFDNFFMAKIYFHKLEDDFCDKGYDTDDDTADLDLNDALEDNFFNNLVGDENTVRLFLEIYEK